MREPGVTDKQQAPFFEIHAEDAGALASAFTAAVDLPFNDDAPTDHGHVDVLRNRYAQTAVPPYAVRPRPGCR